MTTQAIQDIHEHRKEDEPVILLGNFNARFGGLLGEMIINRTETALRQIIIDEEWCLS